MFTNSTVNFSRHLNQKCLQLNELCKNLELHSCSYFPRLLHNCTCPCLLLLVLVVSSFSLPQLFPFDNKHIVGRCGGGLGQPCSQGSHGAINLQVVLKVLVGVSRSRGCRLYSFISQLCFGIYSSFIVRLG